MKIKQFKIRSSAIGNIMTQPKSKADKEPGLLSKGAMTYCETWLKEQIYNRKQNFNSKYTDKGNIMEDNSIDFIADELGYGMLIKNEQYYRNDYITGTPDIVLKDLIIDVKNSWDNFTFPLFDKEIPNTNYYWQGLGYMDLLNIKKFKLVYVLSDTPDNLITREAYYYAKNNGYDELTTDMFNEFANRMTYSDIDNKFKIKCFDVDYNKEDVNKIYEQVIKCREYIKTLLSSSDTFKGVELVENVNLQIK